MQRIGQSSSFFSVLSILIVRVFADCVVNNIRGKVYFYARYFKIFNKKLTVGESTRFSFTLHLIRFSALPARPLPVNSGKPHGAITYTVNNETFTEPTAIANQLNHHFVNIGESLVTTISGSNDNDYLTYLKSPCPSSIYFYPTTPSEVMNMTSKLKINKANGYDDITPFFLKISANIIASPLSAILNQCIAFGYFPNKLKIAKVILVCKAGPTNQPGNY